MPHLTEDDVKRLVAEPSADLRAETAGKIAADFAAGGLDGDARAIAEDIFRLMARDAEMRVRRALAESLKESPLLPRDVALSLAGDVIEVAEPVLAHTPVLTDEDLVDIVRTHSSAARVAIGRRPSVSETVSEALVASGDEAAVATLVANPGAEIAAPTYGAILDDFAASEQIKEGLVHRPRLPVAVAERLVSLVSARLREHLVTHHELSPKVAADLVLESREKATLGLLAPDAGVHDAEALVAQLHRHRRLTPTIVMRALCLGDGLFFEAALARLAGIPVLNAHRLINDPGRLGLDKLCAKAGLPAAALPMVRAALEVIHELDYDGGVADRERFRSRMIERLLTRYEGEVEGLDTDSLDYLIGRIGRSIAEPAVA